MDEEGFVSLVEVSVQTDTGESVDAACHTSCVCYDCVQCDCATDCDQ